MGKDVEENALRAGAQGTFPNCTEEGNSFALSSETKLLSFREAKYFVPQRHVEKVKMSKIFHLSRRLWGILIFLLFPQKNPWQGPNISYWGEILGLLSPGNFFITAT